MSHAMLEQLEGRRLLNGIPRISIGDATITEGNSGTTYAAVVVSLSDRPKQPVSVNYATQNGTAVAGSDYTTASGKVTFAVGEISKTILLPVKGDQVIESDETFLVSLNSAKQAKIADGQAVVTIQDNEPRISITGASAHEGNSGATLFDFTVSLSNAYDQTVTVNFATSDYTAIAGTDYVAASGTLTFLPSEITKTVTVLGLGNTTPEPQKDFSVTLSGASTNALIVGGTAYGSILDDDGYYDAYSDAGYGYDPSYDPYSYFFYGYYGYY
jgi:hypothetical protein